MSQSLDAGDRPSFREQVASLQIGESFSRAQRLDFDKLTRQALNETLENMRNSMCPAVARAQRETGGEYSVESGEFRTKNRDIIAICVATRIA